MTTAPSRAAAWRRRTVRVLAALAVLGITATVAADVPSATAVGTVHQTISGSGSTWSSNALQQWIRNVSANYQWTVNFDAGGSSAGRQQFSQGTVDFAVSEIPYQLSGSDSPDPRPARQFVYIPIVAGGTAFMYNLVIAGQRVTNLRLSGETLAKIFTGVITKWNDPAILADNPKLALPAITIVPVVRSDGSGTTAQLTSWMRSQYPGVWQDYCARAGRANCGITSNFPVIAGSAFVAQSGSDGVAGFVKQDQSVGAITYVEESYALNARFPVAKMLNAAGYYTEPTASNVAVSLLAAVINSDPNSPDYLTANLSGVYGNGDPRTYPLSSYSYMIAPTALESQFTEDKGLTLADFAAYFLCEGQQQAEVLGYSPLPVNLASAGLEQVQRIPGGDPYVKNVGGCNNPTFSPDGTNKLANEAPQPAACDKKGPDQCLTGTGGAQQQTPDSSGTRGTTGNSSTTGNTTTGGGTGGGLTAGGIDGEARSLVVSGSPLDLPVRGMPVHSVAFMVLGVVAIVAAILLPPLIARQRVAAAGQPGRGRPVRTASAAARPRTVLPRLRFPNVHLPSSTRKRGRAQAPEGQP